MPKRVLLVGGRFDEVDGRPSGYISNLVGCLSRYFSNIHYFNGGSWTELDKLVETVGNYDVILWFCDVDNHKPKLVSEIKKNNPKCLLVTSKSNKEGKYSVGAMIAHALKNKSNLFVEFTQDMQLFQASLYDPLGNIFINKEKQIETVASTLAKRINQLLSFTRIGSKNIGPKKEVPEEEEFFSLVREYANKFHELIHGVNHDRMLGNLSFRCESGFPSVRKDSLIFVSRRNVDKRDIGAAGCVAVDVESTDIVSYYGDDKPSVDTPIQVRLYKHFQNIKYMLHSHTYIENAIFTDSIIPCGAIEEFDEIVKLFDRNSNGFRINLRGHGSLVLGSEVNYFRNIPYIVRPIPELA